MCTLARAHAGTRTPPPWLPVPYPGGHAVSLSCWDPWLVLTRVCPGSHRERLTGSHAVSLDAAGPPLEGLPGEGAKRPPGTWVLDTVACGHQRWEKAVSLSHAFLCTPLRSLTEAPCGAPSTVCCGTETLTRGDDGGGWPPGLCSRAGPGTGSGDPQEGLRKARSGRLLGRGGPELASALAPEAGHPHCVPSPAACGA